MKRIISINNAINILISGGCVACATDTVFGIFALNNLTGRTKLQAIKPRDLSKHLCIYTTHLINNIYCDEPYTYIIDGIGYRFCTPNTMNELYQIISKIGDLLGTSCNLTGGITPTDIDMIQLDVPIVLSYCRYKIPSTVIKLNDGTIIRYGAYKNIQPTYKCDIHQTLKYIMNYDSIATANIYYFTDIHFLNILYRFIHDAQTISNLHINIQVTDQYSAYLINTLISKYVLKL